MEQYVPRLDETIRKTGRRTLTTYSEKGRRLGKANSLSAAKKRLRQIEYFKHLNENSDFTEEQIREIAEVSNIDLSQYDMQEILLGMPLELEHGKAGQPDANLTNDDPHETLQIVLAHLKEFDKYYSELLIPAQREAQLNESVGGEFVLMSTDGKGYFTIDSETREPAFKGIQFAYTYNQSEADEMYEKLLDEYGIETDVLPYTGIVENMSDSFLQYVQMFEDYDTGNMKQSDWYISGTGNLYGSDGRSSIGLDPEYSENGPNEDEYNSVIQYLEVVRGSHKIFSEITEPYKNDTRISFGFAGPMIKTGPYAGMDSWWMVTLDSVENTVTLHHSTTGDVYEISDATDLRKTLAKLISDFYN